MLLGPLCRAYQAFLLAVPTAKDKSALRLPSRLQKLANTVHGFEHRRRAAVGVDGTVDPCVAVVSCNDPLVGQFAAPHAADHIPQSSVLIILFEMHLHPRGPRPYVVGKRQRALPLAGRVGP